MLCDFNNKKSKMQNEISGIRNVESNKVGEFGGTGQSMNRILYKMESGTSAH